jgi:hypothetical protein
MTHFKCVLANGDLFLSELFLYGRQSFHYSGLKKSSASDATIFPLMPVRDIERELEALTELRNSSSQDARAYGLQKRFATR